MNGKGYVVGGEMLEGSSLTWEVDSGGGFKDAGSGENPTIDFDMGYLDSNNEMTIALRLTATNGGDTTSVTSHFTSTLCG